MIVINCWAATLAQQKLLTDCIFNLSLLKLDICLVSHNPISSALQSCVDYFIYDSENPLITGTKNSNWWYGNSQIHINLKEYTPGYHGPAVLSNIRNGFNYAKLLNKSGRSIENSIDGLDNLLMLAG